MSSEHKTEVIRAQILSKAVLSPDESELYELAQLAGATMDQEVFKIILDLLKLNVPPVAIIQTLRSMCSPHSSNSFTQGDEQSGQSPTAACGDLSQNRTDLKHQSSRSGHSTHSSRSGNSERQDRSSSRDHLASALSSYSHDGSVFSSFSSGKSSRNTSQTGNQSHSHPANSSVSMYGRNEQRSHDMNGQIAASRADKYVTKRNVSNASEDYDRYRNNFKK